MKYVIWINFILLIAISGYSKAITIKSNTFLYAEDYNDSESGLLYLKARYDDPKLMRFIERDTYSNLQKPMSFDGRYNYGADNPIGNEDPSGHCIFPNGIATPYESLKNSVEALRQHDVLSLAPNAMNVVPLPGEEQMMGRGLKRIAEERSLVQDFKYAKREMNPLILALNEHIIPEKLTNTDIKNFFAVEFPYSHINEGRSFITDIDNTVTYFGPEAREYYLYQALSLNETPLSAALNNEDSEYSYELHFQNQSPDGRKTEFTLHISDAYHDYDYEAFNMPNKIIIEQSGPQGCMSYRVPITNDRLWLPATPHSTTDENSD